MEEGMKTKDVLEGDVIRSDAFAKKRKENDYSRVRDEFAPDTNSEPNSPDDLDNEMDRARYEKLLSNRKGKMVEDIDLLPYVRQLMPKGGMGELNKFTRMLTMQNTHLYELVMYLNDMLAQAGSEKRVVGVTQDAEEWYFG